MRLLAPALWLAETTSVVRAVVFRGLASLDQGWQALDDLLALEIEMVPLTGEHCRLAFGWAARLGQARAYDGFYLAVAEHLGADFWTGDRRLANGARAAGATWVHTAS